MIDISIPKLRKVEVQYFARKAAAPPMGVRYAVNSLSFLHEEFTETNQRRLKTTG